MAEPINDAELLRTTALAAQPDPRTEFFVRALPDGSHRPSTLDDQHAAIAQFVLNDSVPQAIRIHFETAKNLYLYAWFVYRFYPVAELQAFATLEFALRESLAPIDPARFGQDAKTKPALSFLLRGAVEMGVVSNEGMRSFHRAAEEKAYRRVRYEAIEVAVKEGRGEVFVDASDLAPTETDYSWDALQTYIDTIPKIRNMHAHGSASVYNTVLNTFEIVTDLVNQLFPE